MIAITDSRTLSLRPIHETLSGIERLQNSLECIGAQCRSEVMHATRNLHHKIITLGCGMAKYLVHDTASFHPGNDLFNEDTKTGNHRVLSLVFGGQVLPSWFFLRVRRPDVGGFISLEACIFTEHTARGKRGAFFITHAFIMHTSSTCSTAITSQPLFTIDDEDIFHGMVFFFPLYFSCCSVASCGRWTQRSVPSRMQSTATQRARVCSRFFGSLSGSVCAFPHAMFKTMLRV